MTGQMDYPEGFELDYEPLPLDQSLAFARGMVARFYRHVQLVEVGHGHCEDCVDDALAWGRPIGSMQPGALFQFERRQLCRTCAQRRRRIAAQLERKAA